MNIKWNIEGWIWKRFAIFAAMTILNLVFNPPVHFKPVIRSRQSIRARSFESLMMLCCEWDEFSLCCVLYFSILASSKCPSAAACLHSCYVLSTENGVRESREILCRENEMWSHRPESEKGLTRGVGKSITNLFWNKDLWQSRASLGYFIICYIYIYILFTEHRSEIDFAEHSKLANCMRTIN